VPKLRDSHREAVYEAERRLEGMLSTAEDTGNPVVELDGITLTLPPQARFGSIDSIQTYADRVCDMAEVSRVTVRERRGIRKATYSPSNQTLNIPDAAWARKEMVVLHELAHHVAGGEHLHTTPFLVAMNDLLGMVMGPEMSLAHRILCSHNGLSLALA